MPAAKGDAALSAIIYMDGFGPKQQDPLQRTQGFPKVVDLLKIIECAKARIEG